MTCFRLKTATGFSVPIYPNARPIIERRLAAVRFGKGSWGAQSTHAYGGPRLAAHYYGFC